MSQNGPKSTRGAGRARLGEAGESVAAAALTREGWCLLARRFRCRWAEVDLVAIDPSERTAPHLVFIEVKTRTGWGFGEAVEAVDARKLQRLRLAARFYIAQHARYAHLPVRFDVVTVTRRGSTLVVEEHLRGVTD